MQSGRVARRALGFPAVLAIFAAPMLHAQSRRPISLEAAANTLDAGDYYWRDDDPARGEVAVVISRSAQVAYVFRGGTLIGVASVSTGKPGKRTPLGDFTVLQKRVFHKSNIYSNAPMPYMQRLTWDGIALHAGYNPGYPASHGCIRLPRAFAMLLFGVTRMGAAVAIVDEDRSVPIPAERFPVIVADTGGFGADGFAEVTWSPMLPMIAPNPFLRPAASLRVAGDEYLVPHVELVPPARRAL